jgi:hypothetical protein
MSAAKPGVRPGDARVAFTVQSAFLPAGTQRGVLDARPRLRFPSGETRTRTGDTTISVVWRHVQAACRLADPSACNGCDSGSEWARQPIAASFGAAVLYRGFKHWFVSYAFLPWLPHPARWRRTVARSSGAAPALRRTSGIRLPLSFTRPLRGRGLSPQRGHMAPRGAASTRTNWSSRLGVRRAGRRLPLQCGAGAHPRRRPSRPRPGRALALQWSVQRAVRRTTGISRSVFS